jgi:hypothetical protein
MASEQQLFEIPCWWESLGLRAKRTRKRRIRK